MGRKDAFHIGLTGNKIDYRRKFSNLLSRSTWTVLHIACTPLSVLLDVTIFTGDPRFNRLKASYELKDEIFR